MFAQVAPERLLAELVSRYEAVIPEDPERLYFDGVTQCKAFSDAEYVNYLTASRRAARELGLKPGESALVVNGRVRLCSLELVCALDV